MKPRLFTLSSIALALATAPFTVHAAPAPDFSSFKTADTLWQEVEKREKPPTEKPKSREEALEMMKAWFGGQKAAAAAFQKVFPSDARKWDARMIELRADLQLERVSGQTSDGVGMRKKLSEIITAKEASATTRGQAAFMSVMTRTSDIFPEKPETFTAFYVAAEEFMEKYPKFEMAPQMRKVELQVLATDSSAESGVLLKKLAADADGDIAQQAKTMLEQREKLANLKAQPVDLKFQSTDGKDIDLAKLRGKVVLVDFWASWCGPCMREMPNVVSTYGKLHPKGFEILGVSLDQKKEAMEGALKSQNMTWPQFFDGAGWQNSISSRFGIESIPAAWLIDKKGMLRETNLRGEALGQSVEKLLAE